MMVFGPRQAAPGEPWQTNVKGIARSFPTIEEAKAWIEACREAGHVIEGLGTPIAWAAATSC